MSPQMSASRFGCLKESNVYCEQNDKSESALLEDFCEEFESLRLCGVFKNVIGDDKNSAGPLRADFDAAKAGGDFGEGGCHWRDPDDQLDDKLRNSKTHLHFLDVELSSIGFRTRT